MTSQQNILEAYKRGLIDKMEARRLLEGGQDTLRPPETPLPVQEEPRGVIGRAGEALRQAGRAFGDVTGERLGFDNPLELNQLTQWAGPLQPIVRPALDLGAATLEALAGGTLAGASLGGDVLAAATGTDPRQARREMMAMTETPIVGGVGRLPAAARGVLPAQEAVQASKLERVPLMTSDVLPPKTAIGKIGQQIIEKTPVVGTGGMRAAQQERRVEAVQRLADDFEIALDTPFEREIIASLQGKRLEDMARASNIRTEAVTKLKQFGEVPTPSTKGAIAAQIKKQQGLDELADQGLIDYLGRVERSAAGDFEKIKDIRTEVIKEIKSLQKGENTVLGSKAEASLQAVKNALDDDLKRFARKKDVGAAKAWEQSNKLFYDEFVKFKGSELKRTLEKGELTPENVLATLRGGKVSELQRLNDNLTMKGRRNARAALLRGILEKSGLGTDEFNPTRFVNELQKPNNQRAVGVFFKGAERARLDGLKKLLNATRRAQEAAAAPPTGQQIVPFAAGAGAYAAPLETFLGGGTIAAVSRAYESPAMRDFLLRAARSKGTKLDQLAREFNGIVNRLEAGSAAVMAEENDR